MCSISICLHVVCVLTVCIKDVRCDQDKETNDQVVGHFSVCAKSSGTCLDFHYWLSTCSVSNLNKRTSNSRRFLVFKFYIRIHTNCLIIVESAKCFSCEWNHKGPVKVDHFNITAVKCISIQFIKLHDLRICQRKWRQHFWRELWKS